MAVHRLVRSGGLRRFEHHHGQGWFDFRGPVFVPKHRERRQLHCLAVQSGREAIQNDRSWVRRERERHHVRKQATWNTDGSVTLIGGVGSSDIVQCFSKIIPVPDGVEFV